MSLFLSVGVVIFYYIESRANREDKMAEMVMGKGVTAGKLASNVQKKLTRAQEKVRNIIRFNLLLFTVCFGLFRS